jgi:predicted ester cyclase
VSSEESKALVRRLYREVYQLRNLDALEEVIAPDYVLRTVAAGWRPSQLRGPAVYRGSLKVWAEALPDFSCTIEQLIAEGDRVVTVYSFTGTHTGDFPWGPAGAIPATGRKVSLPGITVSRITKGQIVEEWDSLNMGSLWRQLGALPSPPA